MKQTKKHSYQARKLPDEGLHSALAQLEDGFFVFDKQWRCLYISEYALKISDKQRNKLIGKTAWDMFPMLRNTSVYEKSLYTMQTRKKQIVEYEKKIHPGWLAFHIYPVQEGVAIFYYDITKQKKTEEELIENEEKFHALIKYSADIYELLDTKGNILYISDSFSKVFGLSPKHAIGVNIFDIVHPEDKEKIYGVYQYILAYPGKTETVIYRAQHPIKQWIWHEATVINHLNNPAIKAIVVTFRDISERKIAEEKLQESEERFRTLADNIPNLAWIANPDGNTFWYNSRWYEYTGITLKQMEGIGWKLAYDSKELPTILEKWRISRKNGELLEMIFSLKGKDGIFRPFLTRVMPVKDKNGKIVRWFGTSTDIATQKEIEQRKDDFIALASHELKTPLTSTKILTQVLKKRFSNDQETSGLLTKMENQIDKLTGLVTDMIDISKNQQGKLSADYKKFVLKPVAIELVEDLQQITSHILILDWQTKEYVLGDRERIRQVITNFITNAIKYSPDTKEIIIRSRKKEEFIVVSVQDFGVGIPKEEQAKVFERFYQSSMHKTYPGLGLGLYISSEIIKLHGGKIWVESEVGKGSTFNFSLPIAK